MISWAIETLIASTLLMALVLLLRAPVRRAFGPDVAYALWALPALRMLLPPLPASWRDVAAAPITAASDKITIYMVEPLGGNASATPTESLALLGPIIAGLWIVGATAFLGWHAMQHLRFCRRMLDEQVRGTEIEGGIQLIETDAASGPLAFGVVRKYVAFPRDFVSRYDQDERDLALAHELGHHARHDLFANWVALGVLAMHWFNPIAWRAFRAFRADQEIANDARVLAGLSPMARHAYACAIVKSAHGGAVSAACHLHTIHDLKGRLKMLTTNKTSRSRLIGGAAAIAMIGVVGLGLTASGTKAAETVRIKVETATGVNLAKFDVTPPASPAAPAAPAPVGAAQVAEPPAPPAPPAVAKYDGAQEITDETTTQDGKTVKRYRVIMRDKDGKVRSDEYRGMDALKNMPEVTSANCPGGNSKQMVINEKKGGKHRIIICTNRIEQAAADGERMAANSKDIQRNAMQSAITGLRAARSSIEGNSSMSAEQRAEALKGIDEGIAEVTADMAKGD